MNTPATDRRSLAIVGVVAAGIAALVIADCSVKRQQKIEDPCRYESMAALAAKHPELDRLMDRHQREHAALDYRLKQLELRLDYLLEIGSPQAGELALQIGKAHQEATDKLLKRQETQFGERCRSLYPAIYRPQPSVEVTPKNTRSVGDEFLAVCLSRSDFVPERQAMAYCTCISQTLEAAYGTAIFDRLVSLDPTQTEPLLSGARASCSPFLQR